MTKCISETAHPLYAIFQDDQTKRLTCQLMPVFVDKADLTLLWGRVQTVYVCVNSLLNSVAHIILFCLPCTGCSTVTRSQNCPRGCLMDWFPCSYCKFCVCGVFVLRLPLCVYVCGGMCMSVWSPRKTIAKRKKKIKEQIHKRGNTFVLVSGPAALSPCRKCVV